MTELPERLRKAVRSSLQVSRAFEISRELGSPANQEWINLQDVAFELERREKEFASVFEAARKQREAELLSLRNKLRRELKEKIDANLTKEMRRLFALEKKYKKKGDFKQERTYHHCGMTLGINAKREVREAFVAVFGGEKKN